jgi:hypothetical protein
MSNVSSEMGELRKGLQEAENHLKTIQPIEGIQDVFHKVVPISSCFTHHTQDSLFVYYLYFLNFSHKGIKKCRQQFEDLEKLFEETQSEYQKTADLFGENGKVMAPEQFFQTISQFMDSIEVSHYRISISDALVVCSLSYIHIRQTKEIDSLVAFSVEMSPRSRRTTFESRKSCQESARSGAKTNSTRRETTKKRIGTPRARKEGMRTS